jgi:hypothetical protein
MADGGKVLVQFDWQGIFQSLYEQYVPRPSVRFRVAEDKTVKKLSQPGNVLSFVPHRIIEIMSCASI